MLRTTAEAEGEVRTLFNRFKPASNFIVLIVPRRYFCGGSYCCLSWCYRFCAVCALYMFSYFSKVLVTEWQFIDKIAAHSANDVFSWFKYLTVYLVFFPTFVFGVGIFFSPFPGRC